MINHKLEMFSKLPFFQANSIFININIAIIILIIIITMLLCCFLIITSIHDNADIQAFISLF